MRFELELSVGNLERTDEDIKSELRPTRITQD